NFQAVVRRTGCFDGLQALESANAVIDMDHQVARGEARGFSNEILGPPRGTSWPHKTIAEDVLLANNCNLVCLEAGLNTKHAQRNLRLGQGERRRPVGHGCQIVKIVICEDVAHTLTCALAPQSNRHALASGLQCEHVRAYRREYVRIRLRAFGGETATLARAD